MEDNGGIEKTRHRISRFISESATPDVKFSFYESVFSDDVTTVSANMTSLCLHSPVFEQMFLGPLAEPTNIIKIHDVNIKPAALAFCIRNICYEEMHMETTEEMGQRIRSLDDVLENRYRETIMQQVDDDVTAGQFLYTSRVYLMERLQSICSTYLTKSLRIENVSSIYSLAVSLGLVELKNICMKYILAESDEVLCCPNFIYISEEALLNLLKNSQLLADENTIFDAAARWAVQSRDELSPEDLQSTAPLIRNQLGQALYSIRFPVMTHGALVRIKPSGILLERELNNMEEVFKTKERSVEIIFDSLENQSSEQNFIPWNKEDTIIFDSSIDLKLHSLKTKRLKGNVTEIVVIRFKKSNNKATNKKLRTTDDWYINKLHDDGIIHFRDPLQLKCRYTHCVIIKTDPHHVYTCQSGLTKFQIRGVNATATYFTGNFISAVLSPNSYLTPASSNESLDGSPSSTDSTPNSSIR